MSGDGARYRFGPSNGAERWPDGVPGKILTVAVGLVVGVLILRAQPNAAGVGIGFIILVGWRRHGDLAGQWANRRSVVCRLWCGGSSSTCRSWRNAYGRPTVAGLRLLSVGARHMGVVHDCLGEDTDRRPLATGPRLCSPRTP